MIYETERLIIREMEESDIDDIQEGLNDLEVSKWMAGVPYPYTLEHAKYFYDSVVAMKKAEPRMDYVYVVEEKESMKVIGSFSINIKNRYHGIAEGGIWFNSKYHGKGYGSEVWKKRIQIAFNDLNLRRLENGYFVGNKASEKMQLNAGYSIEGIRKQRYICLATGEIVDEVITGLLKSDWERLNENNINE